MGSVLALAPSVWAQEAGGIRGSVYDSDFSAPIAQPKVQIAETGQEISGTDQGTYVVSGLPPGVYTLVISKDGYTRQVKPNVVVQAGAITEVDATLSGEFAEMEEFVVEDLQIGGATEVGLLALRAQSPALIDSVGSDLMSRAGASDAASALTLVSGATVEDGKFAVIRGLPDRYVVSQMNGVRLPTADADKRAVELDQFPSAVIESIQVSKTFTPDQQGDASGGAVNIILRGIPEENSFSFSSQATYNTQTTGEKRFLTYRGGGVNFLGLDDGGRDIPREFYQPGGGDGIYGDAVGVSRDDAPFDSKWSLGGGGRHRFENDVVVGGFVSLFYERNSSFFDDGIDDSYWVDEPGGPMVPQTSQGAPSLGDFKTSLFDVTQSSEEVKLGGLTSLGLQMPNHELKFVYLRTHAAEDKVTLAEDTRGKRYFFPDYDVDDPRHAGNRQPQAAPYLRTETLSYSERDTQTIQFSGKHSLPIDPFEVNDLLTLLPPQMDWTFALSSADSDEPDKRQFGSLWNAPAFNPGFPPFVPPSTSDPIHLPYKPAANFTLGNLQRTWKQIEEDSEQYSINFKFPFKQWTEDEGYLKFGLFGDDVNRQYDQESFSNFNDNSAQYVGDFSDFWSAVFPSEVHPVTPGPPFVDVDYKGEQNISAGYWMADMPLVHGLNVIGGIRFESTELSIRNIAEDDATWFPPGALAPVELNPGDADVDYQQDDVLPQIGLVIQPIEPVTLRLNYAETVARQTFKELTPIQQQEFLGSDVFIGNPELTMSDVKNYDLRVDYNPSKGSLLSMSYFFKTITDPIEYVQRNIGFTYTTPVNYPEGELSGVEFELRQQMGYLWERLDGLTLGGNATLIQSQVTLPAEERARFSLPEIDAPMNTRDMTNAPEYLYNLYLLYDIERTGTQFAMFYTVRGDTLIAGATDTNGNFVPNVYAKEYGTLNLSVTQKFLRYFKLRFQAKNLTDPSIQEVYRSEYIDGDVTKTSYRKGIDLSLAVSAEIRF